MLHPLQGGVPPSLGVCIPGHMCTGGGLHYRGCTFITGGVASTSAASTTGRCTFIAGGVHTRMHVYWGVPSLQPVKNIYSLELKQRFVYETIFIKLKVH